MRRRLNADWSPKCGCQDLVAMEWPPQDRYARRVGNRALPETNRLSPTFHPRRRSDSWSVLSVERWDVERFGRREEGTMARLREYWLETLMTCATAVMLAFTYNVL